MSLQRQSRLLPTTLALLAMALAAAGCARDGQRTTTVTKTVVQTAPTDADDAEDDDNGNGDVPVDDVDDATDDADPVDDDDLSPDTSGGGAPAIVVRSPKPFDVVIGSFVLAGNANVFEANVSYQLTGGLGDRVFLRGYTTATCGTGCRGRFRKRIGVRRLPVGNYTLRVFEASAKDGSHLFEVQVPLTVHR